jgi:hypothetical protein
MRIRQFINECSFGARVKDEHREGTVIKVSKDKDKALVKFDDGMTEWIEYYRIELV